MNVGIESDLSSDCRIPTKSLPRAISVK